MLTLGSSAVRCTCFLGPRGPVAVCLWDLLLELSECFLPAPGPSLMPESFLTVLLAWGCPCPLSLPLPTSYSPAWALKGGGLSCLPGSCHGAWVIHKYLLNEREVL